MGNNSHNSIQNQNNIKKFYNFIVTLSIWNPLIRGWNSFIKTDYYKGLHKGITTPTLPSNILNLLSNKYIKILNH